jgi:phosphomannomutase / phosphoglucomutase
MRLFQNLDTPRANFGLLLFSIAAAAVLLMSAVIGANQVSNLDRQRRVSEARAGQLALALSSYARLINDQAAHIADSAAVRGALSSGDTATLRAAEAEVAGLVPAAHSARLIALTPLGIADPGFDPGSLSNNIEIQLVGSVFKGKNSSFAELFAKDGKWLLVTAAPVRTPADPAAASGVIVIRVDLADLLARHIAPATADGAFSLWSTAETRDPKARIALVGADAGNGAPYVAATGIGMSQAGFFPASPTTYRDAIKASLPMLGLIALGGALLALLVIVAFMRSMAQLRDDVVTLTKLAGNLIGDDVPRLHFPEYRELVKSLLDRRRAPRITLIDESAAAEKSVGGPAPHPSVANPAQQSALDIAQVAEAPAIDHTAAATAREQAVSDEIFRDYDIRGRVSLFTSTMAFDIGRAIGSEALDGNSKTLVVGADGRVSSPTLREQLVRGLLATGVEVIDVGTVATPMLYFACHHLKTLSGVMVTGSHNPPDHNGFKIMLAGETLRGERIKSLRRRIVEQRFREGKGQYRVSQIDSDYQKAVIEDILVDAPVKVVLDCANGAAAVIAVNLFEGLGCTVVPLFCNIDGRFPNHPPDPSVPENLRHLISTVNHERADIGIAFDGDGDRIGVVSASGRIVSADRLLMLFARDVLSRNPGADIVFDVKCSRDLASIVTHNGGRPILSRSGHSWIKEKMKESGALLGGEYTGHICFRDRWLGFDDALYAGARLLEILTTESRSLDELIAELPQSVATPEIRIEVAEQFKFTIMNTLADKLQFDNARLIRIDGVRAEFTDGWGLVRASNTSAALILRFEAENQAALQRIMALFSAELTRSLPPDIPIPF